MRKPWPKFSRRCPVTKSNFFVESRKSGRNVALHVADTRKIVIEETDILLVDSDHTYEQVEAELRLHANKVKKYILFHDTTLYGDVSQYGGKGIWPAIQELLDEGNWEIEKRYKKMFMDLIDKK